MISNRSVAMYQPTREPRRRDGTVLFYYLLAVLAWAPLPLGSNRDWSTRLLATLLLSGLVWALVLLASGRLSPTPALRKACPALLLLTAAQLWVAIQLLFGISVEPAATQQALLLGCGLVAAFTLVLLLADSQERVVALTGLMIACGVFQAFFASVMMLGELTQFTPLEKSFDPGSASGTFVNRNHLAAFLSMNLSVGIGMLVARLDQRGAAGWREILARAIDGLLSHKFRLRLYLVIMVIALVLTRSRMGNTAFFTALLLCGFSGMALQNRLNRNVAIFFASLLLVDLYIVGSWFGMEEVVDRLRATSLQAEKRDEVALDSVAMWREHFWQGTGADTFFHAYIRGGYMSPDSLFYRHAHNDYLEIGAGFGFIGFALLAGATLLSLWQALVAQRKRRNALWQGLGLASAMAITVILIHSLADFNLHIPANSLWFVVIMALGWVAATARPAQSPD